MSGKGSIPLYCFIYLYFQEMLRITTLDPWSSPNTLSDPMLSKKKVNKYLFMR